VVGDVDKRRRGNSKRNRLNVTMDTLPDLADVAEIDKLEAFTAAYFDRSFEGFVDLLNTGK